MSSRCCWTRCIAVMAICCASIVVVVQCSSTAGEAVPPPTEQNDLLVTAADGHVQQLPAADNPHGFAPLPGVDLTDQRWSVCNIPRFNTLSLSEFKRTYKGRLPVVFGRDPMDNVAFQALTTRESLLENYGDLQVILSSSNSYSHGKFRTQLRNYLENYMAPQTPHTLANDTYYLFGDTLHADWLNLQKNYVMPMDADKDEGMRSFGAAGAWSGVSFHTHGAAFAESVHGRKRWFLYAPKDRPDFQGDESQLQWLVNRYPHHNPPLMCTVEANQVIYIPSEWHHATLNLDAYNAFISVFTLEKKLTTE